jgi:hypothetical protein
MYIVMLACAMAHANIRMGKWCPKLVEALTFNKVKVIVECIKLMCVIKIMWSSWLYSFCE